MTDVIFSAASSFRTHLQHDPQLMASLDRLSRDDYATAAVIAESKRSDWPGDVAGRLLLTLSRYARAGMISDHRLRELFEAMLDATGAQGYFGSPAGGSVDEQQVACHGWVISAYLQYEAVTDDARALPAAAQVMDELILPGLERLGTYPLERPHWDVGSPSGTALVEQDGWLLSTDTWCVLLTLNGLVPLWERTGRADLEQAITHLVSMLDKVDLVSQRAQLHATLAAARNIARYAELSSSPIATATARRLHDAYVRHGRTLNWATYNWFGREDTWTEPCAIVDSIGLEWVLWRLTRDPDHLRALRRIERNAIAFAERPDGSFGLDAIATPGNPELYSITHDAWWCCTMRGGLGLIDLRDRSVAITGDSIEILLPRSGHVHTPDGWRIELVLTDEESLTLRVLTAPATAGPLQITVPLTAATATLPPVVGAYAHLPLRTENVSLEVSPGTVVELRDDRLLDVHGSPLSEGDRGNRSQARKLALTSDAAPVA